MASDAATGKKVRKRSTGYERPYAVYCARYEVSERSLKGWVAVGRKADPQDPPPLDQPEEMAHWWSRHFKQRVPEKLLRAGRVQEEPDDVGQDPGQQGDRGDQEEAGASDELLRDMLPPADGGLAIGLDASVDRLRRAEAAANYAFTEAIRLEKNEGEIEFKKKSWVTVSEQLRKAEKSMREIEGRYGDVYRVDEIKAELVAVHSTIFAGVKNMIRRIRPELNALTEPEQDAVWEREIRRLFRAWGESEFCPTVDEVQEVVGSE